MINVIASIRVKPGRRSEFLEIFKSNVPNVRAERGCIEYLPAVDLASDLQIQCCDDNVVTIIEKWEDMEAIRGHIAAPHMLAYREKVKDIVEGVSAKVLQEA